MASGPITLWQIDGETMEIVTDFIFFPSLPQGLYLGALPQTPAC